MSWSNENGVQSGPTTLSDTFDGSAADDTTGDALDGNDVLLGNGGNDFLDGGADDDSLVGGEGDDTLLGGAGNDTVLVGPGQDSMVGGGGTDVLDFSDATSGISMVLAQNEIWDSGFGNTSILSAEGFTVAYGSQYSDPFFAGSKGNDSLFGQAGDDTVAGNDGNDTVDGGDGNDDVSGEAGDDLVLGGAGDDTIDGGYHVLRDPIFGEPSNDTDHDADTLDGGDGFDVAILNRGNATEDLSFTASDSVTFDGILVRNAEAFAVRSGSGNDTLIGGANNDSFDGGTGSDSLVGGEGTDLLVIDHRGSTANLSFIGGDTVSFDGTEATGFEQFKVHGGEGDDSLRGGDGDDTLDGGLGTDSLDGGGGNDLLDGGDSVIYNEDGGIEGIERVSDLVTYQNSPDPISFSLDNGNGIVAAGAYGTDTLVNIEQVVGSAQGDSMEMFWGAETVDILMAGGGGDDVINLVGDSGATLDGGEGNDTIYGGRGNDTILGGEGDDFISGGAGNDSIVATPGNDTVAGDVGDDSILTGEGDDLVIWRVGDGNDTIDLGDGHDTLDLEGWNGSWTVAVDGTTATFTGNGDVGNPVLTVLNYDATDSVVCFAEGTRIMTARGEVPVEALRVGDLALTMGEHAAFKPVRWLGHARIDLARHRARDRVAPVRIAAGALGQGVPHRGLRVSPEHALLIDGALVPAGLLVNGTTIVQEAWQPSVTYWHVELDAHGVLVAEGALAESYLEDGNRHFFGGGAVVALDPDFGAGRAASGYAERACAPVLAEGDAALGRIRLRLAAAQRRVA